MPSFFSKKREKSKLASNRETVLATWTYDGMLAFCAGEAQGCFARGAGAVNVSFSVLEFVFGEFKKVGKALIFQATLFYFL